MVWWDWCQCASQQWWGTSWSSRGYFVLMGRWDASLKQRSSQPVHTPKHGSSCVSTICACRGKNFVFRTVTNTSELIWNTHQTKPAQTSNYAPSFPFWKSHYQNKSWADSEVFDSLINCLPLQLLLQKLSQVVFAAYKTGKRSSFLLSEVLNTGTMHAVSIQS